MPTRTPLSRERVLDGALAVADAGGIAGLTIRSIADKLGVKPMSIYHHVANKEQILDCIVDMVFAEIELPVPGGDWRTEMYRRAVSEREALNRHPWAIQLLQSRTTPGPATLRHHDAVVGSLRGGGFSIEMTAHAFALIDSYVLGFALSEAALPIHGPESTPEVAESIMRQFAGDTYPNLTEFSIEHVMKPGYDFGAEFEFGLDLVLEGLARTLSVAG
jgi:AcrR family transcriptional regulator